MAVTLICPTCALKEKVDDDEVGEARCPHCDEVLVKPKYKAKNKPDPEEDDGEDEKPKKKDKKPAKKKKADDDEYGERGQGGNPQDPAAAQKHGLPTGFDDRALIKAVEDELGVGEVLHFACRPSEAVAKWQAVGAGLGGIFFGSVGAIIGIIMYFSAKVPGAVLIVPGLFVLLGAGMAVVAPVLKLKSARKTWYAVTNRRAIVFDPGLFGSGHATTYRPFQVRNMRVLKSWFVKGAGSVVFRTEITEHKTRYVDRRTGRTTRTETSVSVKHFGFLGVEDAEQVEELIREVLLSKEEDEDGDDE